MIRKIIYGFLLATLIAPTIANAQSKPKRDTSKDRSVIIAKQKEQAKRAAAQMKKQEAAKKHQQSPAIVTPKYASFLQVNQQSSVTKTFSSSDGTETFNVNTDGKEWSVTGFPSWCRLTKHTNSFVLYYDANTSHDDRYGWFKVVSDSQEVGVYITQSGAPLYVTANFNNGHLQHNVLGEGLNSLYLKISTDVTIKGANGQKCRICAFISDEDDYSIKATSGYSNYAISSNNVYAATEITPSSDEEQSFHVDIYLPNNAMKLPKKRNQLHCHLAVYCDKTAKYIIGADYTLPFKAKNKKGRVTTKEP